MQPTPFRNHTLVALLIVVSSTAVYGQVRRQVAQPPETVPGRNNLQVSTVRGGDISGSGTVKLQPSGKGGAFTVDLKAKSGEAITGTIQCTAFTASRAEAG